MEKLIKTHGKYYEIKGRDEQYQLARRNRRTLLFIDSEWKKVIICDLRLQILHELIHYGESLAIVS